MESKNWKDSPERTCESHSSERTGIKTQGGSDTFIIKVVDRIS